MDSNPFEEVKSKSDSTSVLSMTVCADVKALTAFFSPRSNGRQLLNAVLPPR